MKRIFIMAVFSLLLTSIVYADNVTYSCTRIDDDGSTYYLDRKLAERRANADKHTTAGVLTRFGYAFNYDAFTYGVSLFYQWNSKFGITMGFDGYYIPNKLAYRTLYNDTVSTSTFSMPLWDIRAGFMISKYFLFGALMGKSNIGDASNLINMRQDAWFVNNKDSNLMYGGFITFVMPISKHFGFNLDFAVTNKTGFNVGAGINFTIPVK